MKVLVTDPIADAGLDRLRDASHEVVTDYESEGDALLDAVADANALIVRSGTEVTEEVLAAAPDLIIVGRAGIGVDNIDIDAATEHGVIVANAPEGNVRAAAEHTVAMTFAVARVRDDDAVVGGGLDVEVVDADAGAADDDQLGRGLEDGLVHVGPGPDDQRVRVAHGVEQLVALGLVVGDDLVAGVSESVQPRVRDGVGDEYLHAETDPRREVNAFLIAPFCRPRGSALVGIYPFASGGEYAFVYTLAAGTAFYTRPAFGVWTSRSRSSASRPSSR